MNQLALQSSDNRTESTVAEAQSRDATGRPANLPQNISETERIASLVGGAVLVMAGISRCRLSGLLLGAVGGSLLYRGWTGHCHGYDALGFDTNAHPPQTAVPAGQGVKIEESVKVNCTPEELYSFWSNLENLPRVMRHLQSVTRQDEKQSHWVAKTAMGQTVEWDAETINQRDNEMIAWRSLPGGDIDTAGSIHFKPMGNEHTTLVEVSLKYNPPGGKMGAALGSLLGSGLEQELAEDLRHFKSMMEAKDVPAKG